MLNYLTKYFTLNRRERNAVLIMIIFLFALIITRYSIIYAHAVSPNIVVVDLDPVIANLPTQSENDFNEKNFAASSTPLSHKDSLFYFDPNNITVDQALSLGFDSKCAHMLMNYRNKGGKFHTASDLQKLYCMNQTLFNKLSAYIVIGHSEKEKEKVIETKKETHQTIHFEINSADSAKWMSLKGIGPGYAHRILKYRSLLGGYTSVTQLREVYGMTDSLFTSIENSLSVDPSTVLKLKINSAEFKALVHHPYIKYEGTKCIFALKREKKKVTQKDLEGSSCFSREQLEKLLPYLDFE